MGVSDYLDLSFRLSAERSSSNIHNTLAGKGLIQIQTQPECFLHGGSTECLMSYRHFQTEIIAIVYYKLVQLLTCTVQQPKPEHAKQFSYPHPQSVQSCVTHTEWYLHILASPDFHPIIILAQLKKVRPLHGKQSTRHCGWSKREEVGSKYLKQSLLWYCQCQGHLFSNAFTPNLKRKRQTHVCLCTCGNQVHCIQCWNIYISVTSAETSLS